MTVAQLLDDRHVSIEQRDRKSARKVASHAKPIGAEFGELPALDVPTRRVDKYLTTLHAARGWRTLRSTNACSASLRPSSSAWRNRLTETPKFPKLFEKGNAPVA